MELSLFADLKRAGVDEELAANVSVLTIRILARIFHERRSARMWYQPV